jgi:hypothetical protein
MNFAEYWEFVGTTNILKLIENIDTSYGYFRLLKCGARKPSGEMALRIIEGALEVTPPYAPDLELLIRGMPVNANRVRRGEPSKEYIRAVSRMKKNEATVEV